MAHSYLTAALLRRTSSYMTKTQNRTDDDEYVCSF